MKSLLFILIASLVMGSSVCNPVLANELAPMTLLAQADDSYDPFVDYSEFDEASEEEADINFFRNGRFFTLGIVTGMRTFTETLGSLYENGLMYGLYLSFFFDLRFALQITYVTGDHDFALTSRAASGTRVSGNANVQGAGVGLKYYFNTQNVTRGLAKLNPFATLGVSQVTRTTTVEGQSAFGREGAVGFELGAGIEIPMFRNKMYLGLQGLYKLVTFDDENSEILIGAEETGIIPTGDIFNFNVILGINF